LPDFFFIGHCDVPSSEICQKLKDKVPLEYREAWQADFGLDISGCYNIDQAGRILVNASRKKLMREKLKNYIQNHINELSPALETALVLFGAYVGVITIECKPLNKEDNRCFA
jgi:hypothetical protein